MTSSARPVLVPKDVINDEWVKIITMLPRARQVESGEVVATVETSKAVLEVQSPARGFFIPVAAPDDKVAVGKPIAFVADSPDFVQETKPEVPEERFTKPALRMIEQHGIPKDRFAGLELVRSADVLAVLGKAGAAPRATSFKHRRTEHRAAPVIILGASGHGAVAADVLEAGGWELAGFADADPAMLGTEVVPGRKVQCLQDDLSSRFPPSRYCLFLAVGDNETRRRLSETFHAVGFSFPAAVHPKASVGVSAQLGAGSIIMPGAVVAPRSIVGDHAIVNTCASLDHDGFLGACAHLAPGAHLGGNVTVGSGTLVGIGVAVNKGLTIGDSAVIASGFTIFSNVPAGTVVSPKLGKTWW